jgi:hypothetical protein
MDGYVSRLPFLSLSLSLSLFSDTHEAWLSLSRPVSLSLSLSLFGAGAYLGLLCVCEIRYKHGEVKACEVFSHSITGSNWVTFQSAPQSPKTTALLQSNKS